MTKKTIILSSVLVLIFTSTFGQKDTADKRTFIAIKTDLVALSLNAFNVANLGSLTIEKGFLNRHSLQLTGGYVKFIHLKSKSWSLIPEYKFFINKKKSFKGFYTGLYLKYENTVDLQIYSSGSGNDKYITYKFNGYGAGLNFGFQTYIKKHLVLDFLLGFGGLYTTRQVNVPADYFNGGASYNVDNKYPATYTDGRVSINLGYKF